MPSINASISTSSPLLDLTSRDSFSITVELVLDHTHPITFSSSSSGLFDARIMTQDGLSFKEVTTGELISRNRVNICTFVNTLSLDKDNQGSFMTLYPGKTHTVEGKIHGFEGKPLFPPASSSMTQQEWLQKVDSSPDCWVWRNARGFEDGKTYEIGINDTALGRGWLEGEKPEILTRPAAQRKLQSTEIQEVPIHVVKTVKLLVRRSDDNPDWP